jgi:glycerol-3-phosphate acyltransferase PlsY
MSILIVLLPGLSYLIGSIPFGLLLSKGSGIDIRQQGSGNIGATNVARLLGKKVGVLTLLLDAAKGFVPLLAAAWLLGDSSEAGLILALCGAASVLGHMFSVFLACKGGKGVATALGVFLYLAPISLVFSLLVFCLVLATTGFVSLGSLLGATALLPALLLLGEPSQKFWLAAFLVVLIWFKHRANIKRLLQGTEKRLRSAVPTDKNYPSDRDLGR